MTQARALIGTPSPATGTTYPATMVLAAHGIARSTFYGRLQASAAAEPPSAAEQRKRGPKTALDDAALIQAIRGVLAGSPFTGEGYRKVHARLALAGMAVGRNRVHRLMRLQGLLAPTRSRHDGSPKVHDGTIIAKAPNECWGTDATEVATTEDGKVSIFDCIDHHTDQILGLVVTTKADRFAALECLHQAVRAEFGGVHGDAARGVMVRLDHGSQFTARRYVADARHLGITLSYAFVGEPQCNGVIERWHRTLKEQLLWTRTWRTADEVRDAVVAFVATYNEHWLIQRNGHRSPNAVRASFRATAAA